MTLISEKQLSHNKDPCDLNLPGHEARDNDGNVTKVRMKTGKIERFMKLFNYEALHAD